MTDAIVTGKDGISQVADTLAVIEDLWHAGKVEELAGYYTDDAVLTGEGVPIVIRGIEQVRPALAGLVSSNPDAQFRIRSGRALGDAAAETWITVVAPASGMALRVLLVWIKSTDVWQIASESFSAGEF